MADFVHLHLHSEYSLLDGACRISDIPRAAKAAGHSAVAITDHGVMYGAVDFYTECKKNGIKPIIGCEVYVADASRLEKTPRGDAPSHLVLLCKNETGYKNLIYMVSEGFLTGFYSKPRIDMELLREHHEGLVALSACLGGYIPKRITAGDYDCAEKYAAEMRDLFGRDSFYLEVQDHGIPEQKTVNEALYSMSERLGIGLVATNDVHYMRRVDSDAQAILMCIQTQSCILDGKPIGFETDEFYYKETWEMERLFAAHPEALENTVRIAEMCNFDFDFSKIYLPSYTCPDGASPDDYLHGLAMEGLERRIADGSAHIAKHPREEYEKRIEYELSVVSKMGYSQYYLIVWDFVNYSKSKGIPVGPGRGSGAGSLVAFLIGITDIDPLYFDLMFERFLNPERVSMPDFDIDFCYNRRDEAVDYVRQKYGSDHTAQIVTFGTMAARAVVRDVGRALGMSYGDVDAVAKLIPRELDITLEKALSGKELHAMYESDSDIRKLIDMSRALEGMPRHASTHAAGVVITEKPLTDHVPLSVNNGVTVTQFNMTNVAKLGLLKFDFLALRYLTIIDNAEKQIRESDPDFSVEKLPLDDKATYELISKGTTDGVFQLESPGMRQMLMQLKPENFDDIIAAIALFRPGPMNSIPKYIEARHGGKRKEYLTPILAPILDPTFGFPVYQEQVMMIFRSVAGFSLGHADIVRRAISKKHTDELLAEKQAFVDGAAKNGVSEKIADELFAEIIDFANYAFNKSHAAAYALISYRTAYMKTHYLGAYNCALLTSVLNNPAKISEYIAECRKHGVAVLAPDVNRSRTDFHADGSSIRFGLGALKNVGRTFIDQLISERNTNGFFADFDDFLTRMCRLGMNKRQIETLIKSGSLDSLGVFRSRMLAVYEKLMESGGSAELDGQLDIFTQSAGEVSAPKTLFPDIPEFTTAEKLRLERESSGMYLSGHLLDDYSENVDKMESDSITDILRSFDEEGEAPLVQYRDKQTVTVCGIITARTNKATRKGDAMAFVTVEDRAGEIEVVVFPEALNEFTHILLCEKAVAVSGTISARDDESPKILLKKALILSQNGSAPAAFSVAQKKASPIKAAPVTKPVKLYIKVPSMTSPEFLRCEAFISIFRGAVPVVVYDAESGKASRLSNMGVALNEFTVGELSEILGAENVVIK